MEHPPLDDPAVPHPFSLLDGHQVSAFCANDRLKKGCLELVVGHPKGMTKEVDFDLVL